MSSLRRAGINRISQCMRGMHKYFLYFIVLYCIDGVVLAALMHCGLFKIYCAPPNLGITRT